MIVNSIRRAHCNEPAALPPIADPLMCFFFSPLSFTEMEMRLTVWTSDELNSHKQMINNLRNQGRGGEKRSWLIITQISSTFGPRRGWNHVAYLPSEHHDVFNRVAGMAKPQCCWNKDVCVYMWCSVMMSNPRWWQLIATCHCGGEDDAFWPKASPASLGPLGSPHLHKLCFMVPVMAW